MDHWRRSVNIGTITTANTSGGNTSINGDTNAYYYTFSLVDQSSGTASTLLIQETQNTPVTLSSTSGEEQDVSGTNYMDPSDSFGYTESRGVNTVSGSVSASPSTGEKVYIRYSTDGFTTSSFVEATVTGTSWTADIPEQVRGTTVDYYVLTTTVNPTHADSDLQTINFDNNSGSNYSYDTFDLGNTFTFSQDDVPGLTSTKYWTCEDEELTIYAGNQFSSSMTGDDSDQPHDMSGMVIWYSVNGGAYASVTGTFSHTSGIDKFWETTLDLSGLRPRRHH